MRITKEQVMMTKEQEDSLSLSPDFLNVQDVAIRLGVDSSWVTRLCRTGQMPGSFKVNPSAKNSAWLIPETAVINYQQSKLVEPSVEDSPEPGVRD